MELPSPDAEHDLSCVPFIPTCAERSSDLPYHIVPAQSCFVLRCQLLVQSTVPAQAVLLFLH